LLKPKGKPSVSTFVGWFAAPCEGRIALVFKIYFGLAVLAFTVHLLEPILLHRVGR